MEEFSFTHVISVTINEVQGKLNLSGLHRWFKQVYCFGDRLGSLAVDSLGLRGYGSRANSWMPGKPQQHLVGTEKKENKRERDCILCEFMDGKDNCICICFLLLKTCESYC